MIYQYAPKGCLPARAIIKVRIRHDLRFYTLRKLHEFYKDDPTLTGLKTKCYFEDKGTFGFRKPRELRSFGEQTTGELKLLNGKFVRLSPQNRVLTRDEGWVEAQYLTSKDKIACDDLETKGVKWSGFKDFGEIEIEKCFGLVCFSPYFNLISGGIIVHHSAAW